MHVNDRRCHGTIVFLPCIVCMFEAFMLLFPSRNICEGILRFSSCCLSPNSPLGVRQEIVCGTAAKTQPHLIKSRHSWFIPSSQPHEKKLSPGCHCIKKFSWETETEGALLSMKNETSEEKLLALLKKSLRESYWHVIHPKCILKCLKNRTQTNNMKKTNNSSSRITM